jgi:hypothetical protein
METDPEEVKHLGEKERKFLDNYIPGQQSLITRAAHSSQSELSLIFNP